MPECIGRSTKTRDHPFVLCMPGLAAQCLLCISQLQSLETGSVCTQCLALPSEAAQGRAQSKR